MGVLETRTNQRCLEQVDEETSSASLIYRDSNHASFAFYTVGPIRNSGFGYLKGAMVSFKAHCMASGMAC